MLNLSRIFTPGAAPERSLRPESFLFPPWSGRGIYCDAFGLPSGKYEVWGGGRIEPDGRVIIDFNTRLDTGVDSRLAWTFTPMLLNRFKAIDQLCGQNGEGTVTANGFTLGWTMLHKTPFGLRRCGLDSVFEIRSPTDASASTTISLWGVAVGSSASHIRHTPAGDVSNGPHQ